MIWSCRDPAYVQDPSDIMTTDPKCPQCGSENAYHDGSLWVCPDCSHEWNPETAAAADDPSVVKDANGNVLADGDTVSVIKDLKVKGSSSVVKVGTKVKRGSTVTITVG